VDNPGYSGPLIEGGYDSGHWPRRGRSEDTVGNYLGRLDADLFPACTHPGSLCARVSEYGHRYVNCLVP
jgi:hypothetical protein